jgi:hypothetical protein
MVTRTRFVRSYAKHRKKMSERELAFAIGRSIVFFHLKRQHTDDKRLSARGRRKNADNRQSNSHRHKFSPHRQPKNSLHKL